MDCGIKELWSWGTIGSGQNNRKWDVRIKMFGFFLLFGSREKMLVNVTEYAFFPSS